MSVGCRTVINLSSPNSYVTFLKFRKEMVSLVLGGTGKGNLMISVDLKDAYFQISVHPDFQPYFHIALNGKVFQFKALLWSFHNSPRSSPWRSLGCRTRPTRRDLFALLPGQLVCCSGVGPSPASTLQVPPLALSRLGHCHHFGEIKP